MTVVIIEDESLAAQYLIKILYETGEAIDVIAVLDNKEAAIQFFKTDQEIDLIFMDIELGDGQSFEIFEQLQVDIPVIFITAYQEHALKAFKLNSIDYLLKPIRKEELMNALIKYRKHHLSNQEDSSDIARFLRTVQKGGVEYRNRYLAKAGTRLISVDSTAIAYFYIKDRLQFVKTKDGKDLIIDKRMDEIETDIDPSLFFRVNRQFIVNYDSIKKVHTWFSGKIKIEVGPVAHEEIIVGRLRAGDFKKWLGE